ncbi:hypothetical protein GR927_01430 [Mycolicibacterium sp. 3033]|nr:hypothetical protein [Mycolicibacterium aurantiacum]
MRKQLKMALAALMAAGGMVSVAAPAAAAQEGNPGPWEMPDVRYELLQRAIDSVLAATDDADVQFDIRNRLSPNEVINYTNWEVCYSSPTAGSNISPKTKKVVLLVRRPNTSGC